MSVKVVSKEVAFGDLKQVLVDNDYDVEVYEKNYYVKLKSRNEVIKLYEKDNFLYFVCVIEKIANLVDERDLYKRMLELNVDIVPISIGIDSKNIEDARIVIIESLATENLDENEIINVIESFEKNIPQIKKIIDLFTLA